MCFYQLARTQARKGEEPASLRLVRKQLGPDYDVDDAFHAALQSVGPAALPRARTAISSRDQRRAGRRVVTDHIERFTRDGHPAEIGRGARSRHHRDRDGPGAEAARRRRSSSVDGKRDRSRQDDDLQGHDVQRRAESRRRVRLHQRVVDAEGRSHLRVRLPAAATTWTDAAIASARRAARSVGRGTAVARFHLGLRPARARISCRGRAPRSRGGSTRTTRSI